MTKADTPQLENGFVRFATEWLEEFIRADYPGAVKDFVLCIARETWGWNESWREITMPRIADLLGVTTTRAKKLRDEAVRANLVEWEPGRGPKSIARYRVQKDYRNWILHRKTGAWDQRHAITGNDAVTGNSAVTGNDAVTATGNDAVTSNRQQRGYHLIDSSKDTSKDRTTLPPAAAKRTPRKLKPPALPIAPEPEPDEPKPLSPHQRMAETVWTAFGQTGTPPSGVYAAAGQFHELHGDSACDAFGAWALDNAPPLDGAKPEKAVADWLRGYKSRSKDFLWDGSADNGKGLFILLRNGEKLFEKDWSFGQNYEVQAMIAAGNWDKAKGLPHNPPPGWED